MIKLVLNITTGYEALSGARLTISPNKETPDENGPTSTTTNKVMYITCKRLGCVHHRSLPTRKSKNRNAERI